MDCFIEWKKKWLKKLNYSKHIFVYFSSTAPPLYNRSRQNSVFVGSQFVAQKPSRKYQSAMDIHSLVLDEAPEPV